MSYVVFLGAGVLLVLLYLYRRAGGIMKNLFFCMMSGGIALIGVYIFGLYASPIIEVNAFTTAASFILGLPGVVTLSVLKLIFA